METTMNQNVTENATEDEVKIADLLKFTPELEDYIKSYIYSNIDKPKNIIEERFSIYAGWDVGNIQRARLCIFHTEYNEAIQLKDTHIVSYFLHISDKEIKIFLPTNEDNTPDITIDFPTEG